MVAHGRVMHAVQLDNGRGLDLCENPTAAERILGNSPLLAGGSTISRQTSTNQGKQHFYAQ